MRHTGEMQDIVGPTSSEYESVVRISSSLTPEPIEASFNMRTSDCINNCPSIDLLAKQRNCMKILPIYCYNVDDNVLMTTKKQRTLLY